MADQGMTNAALGRRTNMAGTSVNSVINGWSTPRAENMRKMVEALFPPGSVDGESIIAEYQKHTTISQKHPDRVAGNKIIRAIADLHHKDDVGQCSECQRDYPCPTILLIDAV